MDQTIWLTILSFLLALMAACFGWFIKMVWGKLVALEANSQNTKLAEFLGRDVEREKFWTKWREQVDNRLDSKRQDIKDHEHRITRLERNGASH